MESVADIDDMENTILVKQVSSFSDRQSTQARLICAWCGQIIGVRDCERDSHGICPTCREAERRKYGLGRGRAGSKRVGREAG